MSEDTSARSIHWYLNLSWIIQCGFAFAASIFIVIGLAWIELQSEKNHVLNRLAGESMSITRRIANELILGKAGQPEKIRQLLQAEFRLERIEIRDGGLTCMDRMQRGFCSGFENGAVFLDREVPLVRGRFMVRVSAAVQGVFQRIGSPVTLLALLPWTLFTLIGLMIQHRFLRAKFMNPLYRLVTIGPQQLHLSRDLPREVSLLAQQLRLLQEQNAVAEREKALGSIAAQVAHDIRSPLAALCVLEHDLSGLEEEKRILLRSAVNRIKDIANNLLQRSRDSLSVSAGPSSKEPVSVQMLAALLDSLVSEKRLQFRFKEGIEFDWAMSGESYSFFSAIQATEFKRVCSNLINNAVEALEDGGRVGVTICPGHGNAILVRITDNGRGIPPEVQARLGLRGQTHGKAEGSGLGLFHARTSVESWGGSLRIESSKGSGTSVMILLPRVNPPEWFLSQLKIEPFRPIVILDDDESIHEIWRRRFSSMVREGHRTSIHHFHTPEEFSVWVRSSSESESAIYLLDYEFMGFKQTGLSLIEQYSLAGQAYLVSSRIEEPSIHTECERLGIKLIPKGMAGSVPLLLLQDRIYYDAVLLDDDELVRVCWEMDACQREMSFLAFQDPDSFFEALPKIHFETPIYIDSNLGNGVSGERLLTQVAELGFKRVHLATGYDFTLFEHIPRSIGIVGKEPPFGNRNPVESGGKNGWNG